MKRIQQLLAGLLLCIVVHSQPVNDPNIEVRDVKNFHAINISGAFDVYLTQSEEEKVAVSASEVKYLDHIKTEVKDGVLEIKWEHTQKLNFSKRKLRAYISFKNLDKLIGGGTCDLKIIGSLKVEKLDIDLSGATDLINAKLDVRQLSFVISGASDVRISGASERLDIDASGASSFRGYNFSTDSCRAKASGASDISITVNKVLSANATGASDIGYKGSAVVTELKITGSSNVSHKS